MVHLAVRAVARAPVPILTAAGVYLGSILLGIAMVHGGNAFALRSGDQLVGDAAKHDPAAIEYSRGNRLKAASADFAGNLLVGSVPKAVMGLAIVAPYPFVAYQGWIGGIVSVRGDHSSRLGNPRTAAYFALAILLQVSAYSLAVGSGVNVGISLFRPRPCYVGEKLVGFFPKEAVLDALRIYALATPLFFVASLSEFLSPWNI